MLFHCQLSLPGAASGTGLRTCACARVRTGVRLCVSARVRAFVRACAPVCTCVHRYVHA